MPFTFATHWEDGDQQASYEDLRAQLTCILPNILTQVIQTPRIGFAILLGADRGRLVVRNYDNILIARLRLRRPSGVCGKFGSWVLVLAGRKPAC